MRHEGFIVVCSELYVIPSPQFLSTLTQEQRADLDQEVGMLGSLNMDSKAAITEARNLADGTVKTVSYDDYRRSLRKIKWNAEALTSGRPTGKSPFPSFSEPTAKKCGVRENDCKYLLAISRFSHEASSIIVKDEPDLSLYANALAKVDKLATALCKRNHCDR